MALLTRSPAFSILSAFDVALMLDKSADIAQGKPLVLDVKSHAHGDSSQLHTDTGTLGQLRQHAVQEVLIAAALSHLFRVLIVDENLVHRGMSLGMVLLQAGNNGADPLFVHRNDDLAGVNDSLVIAVIEHVFMSQNQRKANLLSAHFLPQPVDSC